MILHGDVLNMLKTLDSESVHCCVTSPPYWGLRDYGVSGQLGLEKTPQEYIAKMVEVFREVRRVLRSDGTVWLNIGDSYIGGGRGGKGQCGKGSFEESRYEQGCKIGLPTGKVDGLKPKDLCLIPFRLAIALQEDGWWVRSDIIWAKPNPMPESVKDRPTKAHEYIFLLAKNAQYYYDYEAILEAANYDGRKDTIFKGSLKYDDETLARVGGERWPNKIRDYKTKDGGNGQSPQHHGADISTDRKMAGRNEGGGGTGFARQSGGYDMETGEWLGGMIGDIPARNKRSVWTVNTKPFKEAHFATFPEALIVPCIKAGCPEGGTVLDPFFGSGTTGIVAKKLQRKWIGIELNAEYIKIAEKRIEKECGLLL